MLQGQVRQFTDPASRNWFAIPTTCLFAVTYWMLEELGFTPTTAMFGHIGGLNALFCAIAQAGHRLLAPNIQAGNAHLPAGAVIVFMNPAVAMADHGCVLKQGLTVGGYNQTYWFTTPGQDHQYSEHDLGTGLQWVGRSWPLSDRRVQRPIDGSEKYLYATPQAGALNVLRPLLL
jgi:hypothetical protein